MICSILLLSFEYIIPQVRDTYICKCLIYYGLENKAYLCTVSQNGELGVSSGVLKHYTYTRIAFRDHVNLEAEEIMTNIKENPIKSLTTSELEHIKKDIHGLKQTNDSYLSDKQNYSCLLQFGKEQYIVNPWNEEHGKYKKVISNLITLSHITTH